MWNFILVKDQEMVIIVKMNFSEEVGILEKEQEIREGEAMFIEKKDNVESNKEIVILVKKEGYVDEGCYFKGKPQCFHSKKKKEKKTNMAMFRKV